MAAVVTPPEALTPVLERLRTARRLLLLLDYDGTLVPFAPLPDLAAPDPALLQLLRDLAARPGTTVHVVSGRSRDSLERWLGHLPIGLHAEHGFWSRDAAGVWSAPPPPPDAWRARVLAVLEPFTARTPGSLIEPKSASFAWHYRMVEPELAKRRAAALRAELAERLHDMPIDILEGDKVIEVRPPHVSKGSVVARVADGLPENVTIAALGDDRTDEELFAALPKGALAIHVGPQVSRAEIRIEGVPEARRLLADLLERPESPAP
jgi:trehalose 6-phosphate synthase/phosphatase